MSAGFHEVLFPPDISYGCTGGPEYSTDIVTTGGGYEQRNINWYNAIHKYQAAHGVKNRQQAFALLSFFHCRHGKGYGFRYKDWLDYQGTKEYMGDADGIKTQFQLVKHYSDGTYDKIRTIKKPVSGTVKVYIDLVEVTSGWTVDTTTGIVTFTAAPASGSMTADFEFHVPCRFDIDKPDMGIQNYNNFDWSNIPIVELKLKD